MKKTALLIVLLSTAFAGKGQNLVPNGDFEQYSGCPNFYGQLDSCLFWKNPSSLPSNGTPDYFNQCHLSSYVGVPNNNYGFENAHSGNGYCGIIAGRFDQIGLSNWREYAEVHLTSSLVPGTCYNFEMYLNLADHSEYTSEEMGVYFSDTLIHGNFGWLPLPYTPQLNMNLGFFTDTLNWVKVYGNYTPVSAINYLIIGNFYDSLNTTMHHIINPNAWLDFSYFYIDDVSLTPCTAIEEQNQDESITIYPNPVKEELHVQSSKFKVGNQIRIYDVMGKEIYQNQLQTLNFKLQTSNYHPGIYFIEINNGKDIFRKKFIKQ